MHTTVSFSVRHLMITNVRGAFDDVRGTVRYDPARVEHTEIQVEIPAASVNTRVAQRDAHLRSGEFFDVERHPLITFRSTRVWRTDGAALMVHGELTMRGVTREVALVVTELSAEQRDHNGAPRLGASATGKIKRSEFAMTYNRLIEAGGVAIGDEISLTIDASLLKRDAR